jgi:hypothetical protein
MKRKIGFVIVLSALILVMLFSLLACNNKNHKVTFMVDGKEYSEITFNKKDKDIELPANPEKEGYEFKGWYIEGELADFSKVTKDVIVVARFTPIMINTYIIGRDGVQGEAVAREVLKINEDLPVEEDLMLDVWYVDEEFKTPYTTQKVDKLYGRYVAVVDFYNGYENVVESIKVMPGESLSKAITYADFKDEVKRYTDEKDIRFEVEDGVDFDFTSKINKNTTINVKWSTPFVEYQLNQETGDLVITGFANMDQEQYDILKSVPVMSFVTKVMYQENQDAEPVLKNVVQIIGNDVIGLFGDKLIIPEGIKYIRSVAGSMAGAKVSEVSLPSTLKVIENCFNNAINMSNINIPDGVEVIVDSFWGALNMASLDREKGYDFDIYIPKSVKNLALVPNNLVFEEGSTFRKTDDGSIVQEKDGKTILIYYRENDGSSAINLPEGIDAVQAGTFIFTPAKYISLPSTLKEVCYNENLSLYPDYYHSWGSYLADEFVAGEDMQTQNRNTKTKTSPYGYAIINSIDKIEKVIFKQKEEDVTINKFSIVDSRMSNSYKTPTYTSRVMYLPLLNDGEDAVIYISMQDSVSKVVTQKELIKQAGQKISKQEILNTVNFNEEKQYEPQNIVEFGEGGSAYAFDKNICSNVYLFFKVLPKAPGFDFVEVNGELEVTGYNPSKAVQLEDESYMVVIPDELEGKKIVKIRDNAFKDEQSISKIYLGKNIREIGDSAFKDAANLNEVVMDSRCLEIIGKSAFENTALTSIALPLNDLKEVGPYAFKIKTLLTFEKADWESEEDFSCIKIGMEAYMEAKILDKDALVKDKFYIAYQDMAQAKSAMLVQYTGNTSMHRMEEEDEDLKEYGFDVEMFDFKLYATAQGNQAVHHLGFSFIAFADPKKITNGQAMRYEVMEGSVYYIDSTLIKYVSKVHQNAFTDMGEYFEQSQYDENKSGLLVFDRLMPDASGGIQRYDRYHKLEDLKNPEVFEDGWYNGYTHDMEDYETKMAFVDKATTYSDLW